MPDKSLRSRLVGGFGGGGALLVTPILQTLMGLELPLGLFLAFESVGVVFVTIAILLHVTDRERKRKQ